MRSVALALITLLGYAGVLDVDQSKYFPLNPGTEWTMDVAITSPKGQIIRTTAWRKIEENVGQDGLTYVRCRTWKEGEDAAIQSTTLRRKDDRGLYEILEDGERRDEQTEVLLPLRPGRTWRRNSQGKALTETVVGVEAVTIGDRTYENCCHIQSQADDRSHCEDYWLAPNIGSVKAEIVVGDTTITLTLREFKPGKG
jgi:hypothetical protein